MKTQKQKEAHPPEFGRMTLIEHLEELRRRLLSSLIAIGLAGVVMLSLAPILFDWLKSPLDHIAEKNLIRLQVLGPMELFFTYMKLGLVAAVFVAAPWVLYQVWLFVSPGLYRHEKRWIIPFVLLGTLFFVGGGAFAFYVVLPAGFGFLIEFTPQSISNAWSVGQYYTVVTRFLLAFGVVFELPLIMWILAAAKIIAPTTFSKWRKYWIVIAWIVAAVLTPGPDPFSQALMAIPLMAFFEIGLLGARLFYRRSATSQKVAT